MPNKFKYNDIIIYKNNNIYTQLITNNVKYKLKQIYGWNGDLTNTCASFLLNFSNPNHKSLSKKNIDDIALLIKTIDNTAVLSTFKQNLLDIYITVSWDANDINSLTKASSFIIKYTLTSFINGIINLIPNSIITVNLLTPPIILLRNVNPAINYVTLNYNLGNTTIIVYTIGLYDHITVTTDNNLYNNTIISNNTITLHNINPSINTIIITLYNADYKKLNSFIHKSAV